MSYVDCHCHLTDLRIFGKAGELIKTAQEKGITRFWIGGYEPQEWIRQKQLKAQYPNQIFTSFGLHPWWISGQTEVAVSSGFAVLEKEIGNTDALGELGLDFSKKEKIQLQTQFFLKQLDLAKQALKPLVLHVVRSHPEVLKALKEAGPFERSGIIHSFSGDYKAAKKYLDLGFFLSMSGSASRSQYGGLQETIAKVSMDFLVVETDSPDQSPEGIKKEKNEPQYLIQIAEAIAKKKNLSVEEVLDKSTRNFEKIFSWKT